MTRFVFGRCVEDGLEEKMSVLADSTTTRHAEWPNVEVPPLGIQGVARR